jgi:hypothetical protein
MATSFSPNLKLGTPAAGDRAWNAVLDRNRAIIDGLSPVGALAVTPHESPSVTLLIDVAAGSYVKQDGSIGTYAGVSSLAIAATSTKMLYLDLVAAGALVVGAAYPTTAHVRLATVVTGSTILSVTDARIAFEVVGSWVDGTNIALGSSTGTKIGTAPTQRLAFFGATPVVQPTVGPTMAGATYTAAEQAIMNRLVVAFRALGLGS